MLMRTGPPASFPIMMHAHCKADIDDPRDIEICTAAIYCLSRISPAQEYHLMASVSVAHYVGERILQVGDVQGDSSMKWHVQ